MPDSQSAEQGFKVSRDWVRAAVVAAQRIPVPHGHRLLSSSRLKGEASGKQDLGARSAADVLRQIGLIQLDPLTRVSTAQRLTCLTRLSRNHRAEDVDAALWPPAQIAAGPGEPGEPKVLGRSAPVSFEAFTKVACVFPIEDWPLLRLRREHVSEKYADTLSPDIKERIKEVVGSEPRGVQIGTIESALDSTRTTGWNWSEIKKATELMVRMGELVITSRDGVVRLFDLPERALPEAIRSSADLPDDDLRAALACRAAANLAVMTTADFAHHYHLSRADAAHGIQVAGLVPVEVQGWREIAYCLPELLDGVLPDPERQEIDLLGGSRTSLESGPPGSLKSDPGRSGSPRPGHLSLDGEAGRGQSKEARLIGPFDPLLRDRRRAQRIFGFDYTFEAYVPKDKRIYGHYVMGLLSGTELIGRVDLWRSNGQLVINRIFPQPGTPARSVVPRARSAAQTLARQLGVEPVFPE